MWIKRFNKRWFGGRRGIVMELGVLIYFLGMNLREDELLTSINYPINNWIKGVSKDGC